MKTNMIRIRKLEPVITVWRAPLVTRPLPSLRRLTDASGQTILHTKALFSTLPLVPEDRNWFIAAKWRADKDQDERAHNSKRLIEAQATYHDLPHSQSRLRLNECLRSLSEQASRQRPELKSKPLQVFISYAHPFENVDSFERWTQAFIFRLRDDLHTAGLQVILDDIHSVPGKSPIDFMENCVKSSDVLLMVGTETLGYKGTHQKADHHEYFVRYELREIWQRHQTVCQQTDIPSSSTPLLPILISGNTDTVFDWMFKEKKYHPTVYEFNEGAFLGFNNVYIGQLKRLIDAIYKHAGIPLKTFDSHWELMKQVLIHSAMLDAMPSASSTGSKPIKNSTLRIFQAPPVNHYFVPRKDLMKKIEERLADSDNVPMSCRLVVLSGMGGIGKTHLVRYYFQAYSEFYKFSGYFNAASLEDLLSQYRELAEQLGLLSWRPLQDKSAVIVSSVVNWLTETGHTLLVYDNVQCALADLELFLPKMGKHTIFVTTRRNDWPNLIRVAAMSMAECQQLISNITGRDENREQSSALSQAMGYLPLAMSQACAHIKEYHLSIQEYLILYHKNKRKLLTSHTMPVGLAHDHYPVWVTFHMAFQSVLNDHQNLIHILKAISFLNPAHIPKRLLIDWLVEMFMENYRRREDDILHNVKNAKFSFVEVALMSFPIIAYVSLISIVLLALDILPKSLAHKGWYYIRNFDWYYLVLPSLLAGILSYFYSLIKALTIYLPLRVNAEYYFFSSKDSMFTLKNKQLTNGIPVLCKSHLVNYDESTEILTVHPLVSEFLFELTLAGSINMKTGDEKQLIGVLQELLHAKYLTIRPVIDHNKDDLTNIMFNYKRLYSYFNKIETSSYYNHRFVSETTRSQCARAFVFFIDLFEMHLYFNDIVNAEECLLEVMNIIAIISHNLKPEETLDCREMYVTLNHAIDKINDKRTIHHRQEFNLSKKINSSRTWRMLTAAVSQNQSKVVRWLYDLGASFTERDEDSHTLLLQSAMRGNVETLKLLLSLGSSLAETDKEGNNALMLASKQDQANMIRVLHQLGVPLSARNNAGETALIVAAGSHGATDAVLCLLDLGASLKDRDNEGYTALLRAALELNKKIIKCLLTNGADFQERTQPRLPWKKPKSVLEIILNEHSRIKGTDHYEAIEKCFEFEWWLSSWKLVEAIKVGDFSAVQSYCFQHATSSYFGLSFFTKNGKKISGINVEDFNGDIPLFYAARLGHRPIVNFLLLKGADYKHRNQAGDSVLHIIIRIGHVHLLDILLEQKDCDIDIQNNDSVTPLMLAVIQKQVETVKNLLQRGANTELRNKFGQRAIDLTEDAMIKEALIPPAFRMTNSAR